MQRHELLVKKAKEVLENLQDWALTELTIKGDEKLQVILEVQRVRAVHQAVVRESAIASSRVPVPKGTRLYPIRDSELSRQDWRTLRRALSSKKHLRPVFEHFEKVCNQPVDSEDLRSLFRVKDVHKAINRLNSALRRAGILIGVKSVRFSEKGSAKGPFRFYHLSEKKKQGRRC